MKFQIISWGWFHSRAQSHFVTQSHFGGKSEPDYGMCEPVSFLVSVSICNSVSFQNETGFEAHLLLSLTLRKKKSEQSLKVRPTMKCPKNWAGWSQFENETDQKVRLSYKLRLNTTMKSPSGARLIADPHRLLFHHNCISLPLRGGVHADERSVIRERRGKDIADL